MVEYKKILITGGTGSLGHELTKKWEKQAESIRIFSRDEFKQQQMSLEYPDCHYFIGDVRDQERLTMACENVDYIVHCAALKQIQTGHYNPFEMVKTNVIGTQNVINSAMEKNVKELS